MKLKNDIAHYSDMLALPFFMITLGYFYMLPNKTVLENLIMFFIFICLLGDILFTLLFFNIL